MAELNPMPEAPPQKGGVAARIRNYFLTGLVVAGPLAITAWLIWSIITWADDVMRPLIPPPYRPETYLPWPIPGTGLIIAFIALTLLGFLTANLVGRTLVELGERLLNYMPIVRPVYKTMKQVFETLFSKSGSSFRKVALVEFPAPGMWSLVFLSQMPSNDIAQRLPQTEHVSAFMPCTPNPTTGFFFYVPRKDLIELDISVESAMTLLISAGMVQPDNDAQKKLAALATTARAAQTTRKRETVD
ncbi:MAG TPA: DUF502 domain-containing protein [Pseudolabrys sp.]|jgi:uncharacterized membrane protein|nr:DUF502 domain-containing protein [Pseudolabrys sp.]